jgi:hypothetical protein
MRTASGSRASPAAVRSTRRVVRSNSGAPSCDSSCRIAWDSGDWAMRSASAARPKCRVSATATK